MHGHGRQGKHSWEVALDGDYHKCHMLDILLVMTPEWQRGGDRAELIRWKLKRVGDKGMGAVVATDLG